MSRPTDKMPEAKMEANSLYREEIFTDRRIGTIQRLTPVKTDGSNDSARPVIYLGQAQLMTNLGALPLTFEIRAASLEEAVKNFSPAARTAIEKAMKELQELRRESASSLIVPQGMPGGGLGGPGGLGGGKIQMP